MRDVGVAERGICPAACRESPPFLQCAAAPLRVLVFEYSSLLTRVIRLKTKISSDCHKEQQFSALPLFRDAVCVVFHILFPFIGCGVVIREQGASIMRVGNLPERQCLAVAGRGGGEAAETCCEHPASDNRRQERKVLPGRGDRQGSNAPSTGAAMLAECVDPTVPPGLAECSNKQQQFLLQ